MDLYIEYYTLVGITWGKALPVWLILRKCNVLLDMFKHKQFFELYKVNQLDELHKLLYK